MSVVSIFAIYFGRLFRQHLSRLQTLWKLLIRWPSSSPSWKLFQPLLLSFFAVIHRIYARNSRRWKTRLILLGTLMAWCNASLIFFPFNFNPYHVIHHSFSVRRAKGHLFSDGLTHIIFVLIGGYCNQGQVGLIRYPLVSACA